MKKIIFDTDMGADCDDAAALALILELEEKRLCSLEGIVLSTTRVGGPEAVQAILDYYGKEKIIGQMRNPVLACDATDYYVDAMKKKYRSQGSSYEAIHVMRRILADAKEKMTLIEVGPLSNLAGLLKSRADEVSELSGEELVRKNVSEVYIMGGSFTQYDATGTPSGGSVMQEWNIVQDIESAQYVTAHCPCEMVLCPFEVGNRVYTNMRQGANPVWYAMRCFAGQGTAIEGDTFRRESWDPVTCLAALQDCSEYVTISDKGHVVVEQDGTTTFYKDESGMARFLKDKGHYEEFGSWIDSLIRD